MPDKDNQSTRELLQQVMAGSRVAFEHLVRIYEKRIYGFLYTRLNHREDSLELTQDVFVSVYQNVDGFDLSCSFDPWIFTIARNACVSHLRKQGRLNNRVSLAEEHHPAVTPHQRLQTSDDCRYLWKLARRHLSEPQYDALWFSCQEGMTIKETAEILNSNPIHVKVLLYRGRRKLFSLVSKDEILSGEASPVPTS